MPDSPVITALKEKVAEVKEIAAEVERIAADRGPSTRSHYIEVCKDTIKIFKESHTYYWIEYIRSNNGSSPSDLYTGLLDIKSWLRDKDTLEHNASARDRLISRLVDEKLHRYRRPRGVIVVAVSGTPVSFKLFVSCSMCNFSSGDKWNRHIALCKAMSRICSREVEPCPAISVSIEFNAKENYDGPKMTDSGCSPTDLAEWIDQFPQSSRSTVIKMTRRILSQHITDKSVLAADILPIVI
jgi:hypothetical protein